MVELITFISLITLGYFVGTVTEVRHYRSIARREKEFLNLPAVTLKNVNVYEDLDIEKVQFVSGSVVISVDYFKRFLAGLRNLFGGEMKSYETLIDRARREAILRMKEMAKEADVILNLRIETCSIGKNAYNRRSIGSIEAIAYGTAVSFKK